MFCSTLFTWVCLTAFFRQNHGAFFGKSDLFFVCMLLPLSSEIHKQESEIEAAAVPTNSIQFRNSWEIQRLYNVIAGFITSVSEKKKHHYLMQWMPVEEFAAQPFVKKHELLKYILDLGLAKADRNYSGFTPLSISSAFSEELSFLYLNSRGLWLVIKIWWLMLQRTINVFLFFLIHVSSFVLNLSLAAAAAAAATQKQTNRRWCILIVLWNYIYL